GLARFQLALGLPGPAAVVGDHGRVVGAAVDAAAQSWHGGTPRTHRRTTRTAPQIRTTGAPVGRTHARRWSGCAPSGRSTVVVVGIAGWPCGGSPVTGRPASSDARWVLEIRCWFGSPGCRS